MNILIYFRDQKIISGAIFASGLIATLLLINYGTVQSADERVEFRKTNYNFTFQYSPQWNVYEIPGMSYLRVENFDIRALDALPFEQRRERSKDYFKLEIVVLPSEGLSLSEWVQNQNNSSVPLPKVLEQTNTEVAGYPAIYQIEQFGSLIHPVIFVLKDEHIYLFNLSGTYESFKPFADEIIESFQFK